MNKTYTISLFMATKPLQNMFEQFKLLFDNGNMLLV